jgi:hypothetical protein
MKFKEERFSKISPENVEDVFNDKILPVIQSALAHAS